jgi:hypothetical protein
MTLGIRDISFPRMARRKSLISTFEDAYQKTEVIQRSKDELFND